MSIDRAAAERALAEFLKAIGHEPSSNPELRETPRRVAELFAEQLCVGYTQKPSDILEQSAIAGVHGEVVARELPVLTTCPHHLTIATGRASVGFLARDRGVGLGAIADVVKACSRRLVLQEQIGELVVSAIFDVLHPEWAFCKIDLAHGCMSANNEALLGAHVETLAVRGDRNAPSLIAAIAAASNPAKNKVNP